jgi:hypothetical protein
VGDQRPRVRGPRDRARRAAQGARHALLRLHDSMHSIQG